MLAAKLKLKAVYFIWFLEFHPLFFNSAVLKACQTYRLVTLTPFVLTLAVALSVCILKYF